MVSKIAVVALVVIVACPILLGYAMNLDVTTNTEYEASKDPIDTTPLLLNDVAFNYAHVNYTHVNTITKTIGGGTAIPIYNKMSNNFSSLPMKISVYYNQSWSGAPQNVDYDYFYEQFDYDPQVADHSITIYGMVGGVETSIATVNHIHSFYYDKTMMTFNYTFYQNPYRIMGGNGGGELTKIVLNSITGTTNVYVANTSTTSYADISAGYYFKGETIQNYVDLPDGTKSCLMTLNLGSITDANYSIDMIFDGNNYTPITGLPSASNYRLEKTTVGGVVSWKVYHIDDPTDVIDLYYDPARTDNTYQIYIETEMVNDDGSYKYYTTHREFRYIGGWPTLIGEANYYLKYTDDFDYQIPIYLPTVTYNGIGFSNYNLTSVRSPTIRVDDAIFGAFNYRVISDNIYDPATFRTNPITTLKNPRVYGTSIEFGGNTYNIKDGNLEIGTREISINNITFSSELVNGVYLNKINGNVVSTMLEPSKIRFNGVWSVDVVTDSMVLNPYTKTTWTPGQFGWDGLDQNFLMVGLLTSIGAFIGLGIVIRRTKAALWPLLIVCGGAAVLFFIML